jgi:hypothetical protein
MTALQQTTAVFVMLAALQPCMQAFSIVEVRKAEQGCGAGVRRRLCPLPAVSKVSAADKDFTRALDTTESLVRALRARTPRKSAPLNLETDFYDPSTGLHSEGVWHNSLIGIASLALMASGREAGQDMQEAPRRIASSLWTHAWDGVSFRRRARSGRWDHMPLDQPSSAEVVQPAYYRASSEHRCVQHGMVCVFWALLREVDPEAAGEYVPIAAAFVNQFWDTAASHWTTTSRAQGVATGARPSASTGTSFVASSEGGVESGDGDGFFEKAGGADQVYYRAVDHSVALLALVSMVSLE